MQIPPPLSFDPVLIKGAQCAASNEISIFSFFHFIELKNKNQRIDFSFVSALSASFMYVKTLEKKM